MYPVIPLILPIDQAIGLCLDANPQFCRIFPVFVKTQSFLSPVR